MPSSRGRSLPARFAFLLLLRATIYTPCSGERGVESASFVHIPKTGGTSIHRALLEAGCPALRVKENTNHLITASKATRGGRRCFLVLREPTDRFVSSYSYFISQSALRGNMRKGVKQGDIDFTAMPRATDPRFPTAGSLIDAAVARNKSAEFLDRAVMFEPQSKWVDVADFALTTVVCYDARHLAERVSAAVRRITVPPCNVTIPRINAAPRHAEENDLNDAHRAWLAARYERDYALWQEHCGDGARRARESTRERPARVNELRAI